MSGLKLVENEPFNEEKNLFRLKMLRAQLLAAAIRFVRESASGKCVQDRVRYVSDLTGIPRTTIEVEMKK